MSSPDEDFTPTWRRGLVTAVDAANAKVRVQFPDSDGLISNWLAVVVPFALGAKAFWVPRLNSQVIVLVDENLEDGVVLGAVYSKADPVPSAPALALHAEFEDGTILEYDPTGHALTANVQGTVAITATGNVSLQTSADVNVTATGHVNATCATSTIQASSTITLQAPIVSCTAILQVAGVLQANGGISTTSGGAVPNGLHIGGTVQSDTGLTAPDATLGGKGFLAHKHGGVTTGAGQTGTPV